MAAYADYILWVPENPWRLSPVATAIPLQLLAYNHTDHFEMR